MTKIVTRDHLCIITGEAMNHYRKSAMVLQEASSEGLKGEVMTTEDIILMPMPDNAVKMENISPILPMWDGGVWTKIRVTVREEE